MDVLRFILLFLGIRIFYRYVFYLFITMPDIERRYILDLTDPYII